MFRFCFPAMFFAYSMDRFEKSIPVTDAPVSANWVVYNPGPQPKSHTDLPAVRLKWFVIQFTDLSTNSFFREAGSTDSFRWSSSICLDMWGSFHKVSVV